MAKNFFTVVLYDPKRKSLMRIAVEYLWFNMTNRTIGEQYFKKYFYRRGMDGFANYLLTESLLHKCWNLNDRDYISVLDNKYLFEAFFTHHKLNVVKSYAYNINSVFFTNRGILQINSPADFSAFLKQLMAKTGSKGGVFVKKKEGSCGGKGIFRLSAGDLHEGSPELAAVFRHVIGGSYLFQEQVIQHEGINALNPHCLNTLRIDTFTNSQNVTRVLSSFIRLGVNRSYVDNVSSGGVFVGIDLDTGRLYADAFSDFTHGRGKTFREHPETSQKFEGYEIPFFQEAMEMAVSAAVRLPQIKVIGWDIGIRPDGPVLLEGNDTPGLEHSEIGQKGYLHNPVFMDMMAEAKQSKHTN